MRSVVSTVLAVVFTVLLSGCGSGESTSGPSGGSGAAPNLEDGSPKSAEGATEEAVVPTVFGVDGEHQREIRSLLAQFIEQRQFPGDQAENLARAFDSAMNKARRPASEFGIEPDADGNLEWPDELEERLRSLRAEFDGKILFDSHEIDLPEWANPLLEEHKANTISPIRKELLFRLASGDILLDMS